MTTNPVDKITERRLAARKKRKKEKGAIEDPPPVEPHVAGIGVCTEQQLRRVLGPSAWAVWRYMLWCRNSAGYTEVRNQTIVDRAYKNAELTLRKVEHACNRLRKLGLLELCEWDLSIQKKARVRRRRVYGDRRDGKIRVPDPVLVHMERIGLWGGHRSSEGRHRSSGQVVGHSEGKMYLTKRGQVVGHSEASCRSLSSKMSVTRDQVVGHSSDLRDKIEKQNEELTLVEPAPRLKKGFKKGLTGSFPSEKNHAPERRVGLFLFKEKTEDLGGEAAQASKRRKTTKGKIVKKNAFKRTQNDADRNSTINPAPTTQAFRPHQALDAVSGGAGIAAASSASSAGIGAASSLALLPPDDSISVGFNFNTMAVPQDLVERIEREFPQIGIKRSARDCAIVICLRLEGGPIIPRYPNGDILHVPYIPPPPRFPEGASPVDDVWWLIKAYRGAAERWSKESCFIFANCDIQKSPHFPMLRACAKTLRDQCIAPAKWVRFSFDTWIEYLKKRGKDKNKKELPPLNYVFGAKRLESHLSWFERESTGYDARTLVLTDESRQMIRRHTHVKVDCQKFLDKFLRTHGDFPSPAWAYHAYTQIMDEHFPGGYQKWLDAAIAVNERQVAQIKRYIAEGEYLWS